MKNVKWYSLPALLGVSGFVASIIILSLSIYMILHATKKIRRFSS